MNKEVNMTKQAILRTNKDIEVKEAKRTITFVGGTSKSYYNVKWFNPYGSFLRFESDEGYCLINTANVLDIVIDGERVK